VEGGGTLIGFRGSGGVLAAQQVFDEWANSHDWPPVQAWHRLGGTRHARYGDPARGWMDVQLSDHSESGHAGLVVLTPPDGIQER
jgi:hypothetical protein